MVLRGKAGTWGTSLATDAEEGPVRSERAIADISGEFLPRVDDIARSFHSKMQSLLALLAASESE